MNNIEEMLSGSDTIEKYISSYFDYLNKLLRDIDKDSIAAFARSIEDARKNDNTIFIIGNGGSAATALHMVNDFTTDIKKRTNTKRPYRVVSLVNNVAVMLAVSNDDGYENLFVNQLRVYFKPGDKLIAISASGNSPNIVSAAKWVKEQKGEVMAMVGFNGGELKAIADVTIHVKSLKGEYGPVEDIHMIMDHLLSSWLQYQIQKEENGEKR